MTKTYVIRLALALASIAVLALLLPVLGMVLLGLLTLVLPALLVLTPVLALLAVGFVIDRLRGHREPEVHSSPIWASAARPSSP